MIYGIDDNEQGDGRGERNEMIVDNKVTVAVLGLTKTGRNNRVSKLMYFIGRIGRIKSPKKDTSCDFLEEKKRVACSDRLVQKKLLTVTGALIRVTQQASHVGVMPSNTSWLSVSGGQNIFERGCVLEGVRIRAQPPCCEPESLPPRPKTKKFMSMRPGDEPRTTIPLDSETSF